MGKRRSVAQSNRKLFVWATGLECTQIPWPRPGRRRLVEYELTGHDRQFAADFDRAASLGIRAIRVGIPWHRIEPARGRFVWDWTDRALGHLATLGLMPIADLVHFGAPTWLDRSFDAPDFPAVLADYAGAFADRYRSIVRCFTPMNEPGVAARIGGRDGHWPPGLRGVRGFVRVLMAAAAGVARAAEAIRSAVPDAHLIHVEDIGTESAADPTLRDAAEARQALRLLPLDLLAGRVGPGHPRLGWLIEHGAGDRDLADLASRPPDWDVLGINYYPWSSRILRRRRDGRVVDARDPTPPDVALPRLLWSIHDRYQRPVMVTETSSAGPVGRRLRWLDGTTAGVARARALGVPVVGYTWYPMISMVDWRYGRGRRPLAADHWLHLGLWDVDPADPDLPRRPTPLVDAYRRVIAADLGSAEPIGYAGPREG